VSLGPTEKDQRKDIGVRHLQWPAAKANECRSQRKEENKAVLFCGDPAMQKIRGDQRDAGDGGTPSGRQRSESKKNLSLHLEQDKSKGLKEGRAW